MPAKSCAPSITPEKFRRERASANVQRRGGWYVTEMRHILLTQKCGSVDPKSIKQAGIGPTGELFGSVANHPVRNLLNLFRAIVAI
jgi:hypothetical protein